MTTPMYDTVAYVASNQLAVANAAGDSFVAEFAPGLRLRADCGTDGVLLGTVASASLDGASRTVVTTAMDGGAALTANLIAVLHGNDLPESLCAHAALHALGGRDALPAASAGVSGLVSLASAAETQAGASAAKAVTPAGLAASAKGLIATNTTLYVATTGSDATGTGSSSAPYASIAKALSGIAGKLIASGVTVTIQVADGSYTISSTVAIDHPDADKIQILGNTSAETTVAIASIDTTAKTFTVVGNFLSNSDAAKNIQAWDYIGLTGSSTSGLNGAYVVSGVSYDGTNTVVTCSAETIASSTVGGGSLVIKPCARCVLNIAASVVGFRCTSWLKLINGFTFKIGASGTGIYGYGSRLLTVGQNNVFAGGLIGVRGEGASNISVLGGIFKSHTYGVCSFNRSLVAIPVTYVSIIDSCTLGIYADNGGYVTTTASTLVRSNTTSYSPALNTSGNGSSYIKQ